MYWVFIQHNSATGAKWIPHTNIQSKSTLMREGDRRRLACANRGELKFGANCPVRTRGLSLGPMRQELDRRAICSLGPTDWGMPLMQPHVMFPNTNLSTQFGTLGSGRSCPQLPYCQVVLWLAAACTGSGYAPAGRRCSSTSTSTSARYASGNRCGLASDPSRRGFARSGVRCSGSVRLQVALVAQALPMAKTLAWEGASTGKGRVGGV